MSIEMDVLSDPHVAERMAALGNPSRLRLLRLLREKALRCCDPANCDLSQRCCTVSELAEGLGLSLATTSHHLRELRRSGLIAVERRGRHVYCEIDGDALRALAGALSGLSPTTPGEEGRDE